jgi:Flp pilus assembly pilin Flp
MCEWLCSLCRDEDGQDLIEYSLLIAFIAIACAALLGSGAPSINGIWLTVNSRIVNAGDAAKGGGG